jgi:acyl CoA:acetate/3-ketoacid CoA transferase beta subunit
MTEKEIAELRKVYTDPGENLPRLLATVAARDLRIVYLEERVSLGMGEIKARDEEIARLREAIEEISCLVEYDPNGACERARKLIGGGR